MQRFKLIGYVLDLFDTNPMYGIIEDTVMKLPKKYLLLEANKLAEAGFTDKPTGKNIPYKDYLELLSKDGFLDFNLYLKENGIAIGILEIVKSAFDTLTSNMEEEKERVGKEARKVVDTAEILERTESAFDTLTSNMEEEKERVEKGAGKVVDIGFGLCSRLNGVSQIREFYRDEYAEDSCKYYRRHNFKKVKKSDLDEKAKAFTKASLSMQNKNKQNLLGGNYDKVGYRPIDFKALEKLNPTQIDTSYTEDNFNKIVKYKVYQIKVTKDNLDVLQRFGNVEVGDTLQYNAIVDSSIYTNEELIFGKNIEKQISDKFSLYAYRFGNHCRKVKTTVDWEENEEMKKEISAFEHTQLLKKSKLPMLEILRYLDPLNKEFLKYLTYIEGVKLKYNCRAVDKHFTTYKGLQVNNSSAINQVVVMSEDGKELYYNSNKTDYMGKPVSQAYLNFQHLIGKKLRKVYAAYYKKDRRRAKLMFNQADKERQDIYETKPFTDGKSLEENLNIIAEYESQYYFKGMVAICRSMGYIECIKVKDSKIAIPTPEVYAKMQEVVLEYFNKYLHKISTYKNYREGLLITLNAYTYFFNTKKNLTPTKVSIGNYANVQEVYNVLENPYKDKVVNKEIIDKFKNILD